MLGSAFGDHVDDGVSEWLEDRAHRGAPCTHCGSDQTLVRHRAASARGVPLHRHSVTGCLTCERWSVVCFADVSAPQELAWQ